MDNVRTSRFMRTDIWREGAWVDLWSVVHVLSGILLGLFFHFIDLHFLNIPTLTSIILAVLLLSAYELFEVIAKIEETPTNRFMDVVVGMAGYLPAFFLTNLVLSGTYFILVFGLLLFLTITMSVVGWRASQKAAVFEKRFHARLARNRTRLKEQGDRLRAKYRKRK